MSDVLIAAMLFHILWVAMLYVLLTVMRAPKIWGIGAKADGTNPFAKIEPRASANLSNQFEWPVLFYAICTLLIARPDFYQPIYLWFAWLFVVGRIIHSIVQIFTTNIRLRGLIFTINFVAVMCMWLVLALDFFG
ncbi:MAPEG family protein [Cellvibrio sp. OA-2007]|uniref:MAPEG family protein n=1 Tax=Cellvibrio sp. OA-2007 TaxID=529823 RepID=UPI000780CBFD|nr:MAPEG family protein [Cellvibrio sp. OA-2007]